LNLLPRQIHPLGDDEDPIGILVASRRIDDECARELEIFGGSKRERHVERRPGVMIGARRAALESYDPPLARRHVDWGARGSAAIA
jgi:hypothetical protein